MLLLSLQKLDQAVKRHPNSISHSAQGSTLPFPGGPLCGTPPPNLVRCQSKMPYLSVGGTWFSFLLLSCVRCTPIVSSEPTELGKTNGNVTQLACIQKTKPNKTNEPSF